MRQGKGKKKKTRKKGLTVGTPVEKWAQSPQDCIQHASKLPKVTQLRVLHPNSSPDGLTFPSKQVPGLPVCSFLGFRG